MQKEEEYDEKEERGKEEDWQIKGGPAAEQPGPKRLIIYLNTLMLARTAQQLEQECVEMSSKGSVK